MTSRFPFLIALAAGLALGAGAACGAQERVTGRANVIDGDSFKIGAAQIRLFGIDAPEGRQSCTREGEPWRCGDAAAAELRRLTRGRDVTCIARDRDIYGRMVATCRLGDLDLGSALVSSGFAVAYRLYSQDYVADERAARAAKRGLWAGEFTRPDEWRRAERAERAATAAAAGKGNGKGNGSREGEPNGCGIKGNINARGDKIYHLPGSALYDKTSIDAGAGERWFCTEAQARAAGWRAPR